jgi:hypothetical protein
MLVWKPKTPVKAKPIHTRGHNHLGPAQERYGYLLDGQQRLTALLHLRERNEDYPLAFYAWPNYEADGDKRFYWRAKGDPPSPWVIPVSDALCEGFDVAKRLAEIRADPEFKPEHESTVLGALTSLASIRNYPVGVVEFETDDYRKATELFVRFNSTGRKLSRGDLSMAQLAVNLPEFASSKLRPAGEKWKAMSFTAPYLVQCLLAVHTDRFQVKDPEKFWAGSDARKVSESWRQTERAIGKLVTFLTGTTRWGSGREIPSFNALIPLVYLLAKGGPWDRESTLLARRWLLLACMRSYFSGSAQTTLDKVLKAVSGEPTPARLWAYTKSALPKLRPEDFETSRLSGPAMSLYLSMLRDGDAKDWGPSRLKLDGMVIGHGAKLQVHHFFPARYFANIKSGRPKSTPRQLRSDQSDDQPQCRHRRTSHLYSPRLEIGGQGRSEGAGRTSAAVHPPDPKLWHVAAYGEFLAERRKLLASAANKFLGL